MRSARSRIPSAVVIDFSGPRFRARPARFPRPRRLDAGFAGIRPSSTASAIRRCSVDTPSGQARLDRVENHQRAIDLSWKNYYKDRQPCSPYHPANCGGGDPTKKATPAQNTKDEKQSKLTAIAKFLAKWADKAATLIGFIPFCTACTAVSMVLEGIAGISELILGNKGRAIKDLLSVAIDGLGFVAGGAAASEVAYRFFKSYGVTAFKTINKFRDGVRVVKFLPTWWRKAMDTTITSIVSGLGDLQGALVPDATYGKNSTPIS